MPRDVLLILVLVAVVLNLLLLVGVGFARWGRVGSPSRPMPARPTPRAVYPESPTRGVAPTLGTRTRPAPWSPTGVRDVPGIAARERTRPITSPLDLAAPDVAIGYERQPVAPTSTQRTVAAPTIAATLDAGRETNGQAPPDETPSTTASDSIPAEPATRRGRRFVLPRNDEDKGRTERAIEAFLGEPAPSGSTSTHRPRRRARRRGTPGEAGGPLVLVAALGGFEQLRQTVGREGAVRFAEAYGEALRATMRSGDHVTDLGQGRLRLVVHADEEGAQALMDRARGVCEPWLRLAPVPLALRVRPMPDPRSGNGHRPGGHPDRRRPEERPVDGSPSGGGSAHPASGRPNDADARRFAAG